VWEQIFGLIDKKQPKAYDETVALLVELRELAQHRKQVARVQARINQLYAHYRSRPGLLSRLSQADLVKHGS